MRIILLAIFIPLPLLGQLVDTSRVSPTSTKMVVKHKTQYLLFPAILAAFASALYFRDAAEQNKLSHDLDNQAQVYANSSDWGIREWYDITHQQSLGAAKKAKTKFYTGLGLAAASATLVWFAFRPTYVVQKGALTFTPTADGFRVTYTF